MHVLRPDYAPASHMISDYGVGPYGWTDLPGGLRTRAGEIHSISFLVNIGSIIVAMVLLSVSFGSSPRWRTYRSTAVVLTLLILVAFVIQFRPLHRGMPYGLANRLFLAVLFAWFLATAFRLRTLVRG